MLKSLAGLAQEAGIIIRNGITAEKNINYKGKIDLVTEYDVAVEVLLKEKLSKLFPTHEIIAEESSMITDVRPPNAIYIDPIDGTTNFVHGFPFVSISVGIYTQGIGTYGVVYNPLLNEMFTAEYGKGAYMNGQRIYVSAAHDMEHSLCATGFPYKKETLPQLMVLLEKVLSSTRGIRRAGSAALDLCYTARGIFDLYYETTLKPWDVAAGVIILREAGGTVTDFSGKDYDLVSDALVASNGKIHEEFMKLLK